LTAGEIKFGGLASRISVPENFDDKPDELARINAITQILKHYFMSLRFFPRVKRFQINQVSTINIVHQTSHIVHLKNISRP